MNKVSFCAKLVCVMRIYFLGTKGFPANAIVGGGGVERHVEELATRLAGRGHSVYVYVRAHSADKKLKTYRGVHIIRIPSWRSKNFDTITHTLLSTLHVLFRRADVIHYHGIGPSTCSLIPRLFKWRTKVLATFHSRDRMDPKWSWFARAYLLFAEWACLHFPHQTIVVSHILQIFCREMYGKETRYIPNGADISHELNTDQLQKFGLEPGKYLLGLGRLVPNKAYDVLMEAYKKVESNMPLIIAGDAEYADAYVMKLEKMAAQDPRVRLVGYQIGKTKEQLLAHCYAFVQPSRSEGLSTVTLEAMAHGKTVVLTDIKENLELIDHSAIAFPVDNVRMLAQTLKWILEDPMMVRVRGERAQEVVRKWYSWQSVVDRIEKVYFSNS
ncbi:glycosyltransferase family 4 protein [Candidatus Uhrbacteria bacterium]|nr:glycosyltransferase family 4 protein [Candidatus Uhrbacteria bacterium]